VAGRVEAGFNLKMAPQLGIRILDEKEFPEMSSR